MENQIQLLQFLICEKFQQQSQDGYVVEGLRSNIYVNRFPHQFKSLYAVTCWRKDTRFHKEVIEYLTDEGVQIRSPHMDIEPVQDSIIFRWHTHRFPTRLVIKKPTKIEVKVILDGDTLFKSYILIEKLPAKQ